jgi:Fe-S cluster biogenesis protein NfuA
MLLVRQSSTDATVTGNDSQPKHPQAMPAPTAEDVEDVEQRIIEVIDEYVLPNVQLDGGDCHFHAFDRDSGVLTIQLAGACVDCPSATVTLRFMIKNVILHYVPEVTNVVRLGCEEDDL